MKFLIISHVQHKRNGSRFGGYGPYVREMNLWLKHVDAARVLAPIKDEPFDPIDLAYEHKNLEFVSVPAFDLTSPWRALRSMLVLPIILWRIFQGMHWADHIHLRCPGNMGLLGSLVQILFPKKTKTAKYAGNWDRASRQPWSYKLQQIMLSNTFITRNMQALVYGEWPNQTRNIKNFFTATYHQSEIKKLSPRHLNGEIKLVFIGGLTSGKQPLLAVKATHELHKTGLNVSLELMGEGEERVKVKQYIAEHNLEKQVRLLGNVDADTVKAKLKEAHFLIFISKSEGWPKVVAESMFWGCVVITTHVSCVPYMLGEGSRGTLIEPTVDAAVEAAQKYLNDPELYHQHSRAATEWSQPFTLERFEAEIVKLLDLPQTSNLKPLTAASRPRVLHLIDSLALGGSERMAVNLCNAVAGTGCEAHLCATRKSGPMKEFIAPGVSFFELNKKSTVDLSAIRRLKKYIGKHGIQVIHAHSSSFFMGCLMKWLTGVRLVWHDHNGKRVELSGSNRKIRFFSLWFDAVFCVNAELHRWAVNQLNTDPQLISYIPNFPFFGNSSNHLKPSLPGSKDSRIVCTANLRFPKDHATLVTAMRKVYDQFPNMQLFLVGTDYNDDYSTALKSKILQIGLEGNIHILGQRSDIAAILNECSIGVLSSESEGLPVSLLEYGLAGLAVVCTDVGECAEVLGHGKHGKIIPPKNSEELAGAIIELFKSQEERNAYATRFQQHVKSNYSGSAIAREVMSVYSGVVSIA